MAILTSRECCAAFATKLKQEFHWTRLFFRHEDWRTVAYSPWLPYNHWQVIYVLWRVLLAVYFFAWMVAAGVERGSGLHLIFLTNWCFIAWELYLIVACAAILFKFAYHLHQLRKGSSSAHPNDFNQNFVLTVRERKEASESPEGAESFTGTVEGSPESVDIYREWRVDRVAWYQKIQWILFTLGTQLQIIAVVLYWGAVYNPNGSGPFHSSAINFHVHLIGGIAALVDICVSGIMVNIYHMYEMVIFGIVYMIFSGVYYGLDGRNQNGNRYIYPVLDYDNRTGTSVGVAFGSVFGLAPVVHFLVFLIVVGRRWTASVFRKTCYKV